ncbi:MAG: sugar ABC transporter permease [Planctomycetota bacterium]
MSAAPPRQASTRRKPGKLRAGWAPYFFIAPFALTFFIFMIYPLGYSMLLATRQTAGPSVWRPVGLANFYDLLTDPEFWLAMKNTSIFALASISIQLPASLALALLLNRPDVKGRAFWRMIFFAPSLVGLAFVAILASLIFAKNNGLMNQFTAAFGGDPEFPWLETYILPAIVIASFWMYVGFNMVYFLAALQSIDKSLIEAAMVDGAGPWDRFLHVTIPSIRPIGSFIVLLSLIGSFQLFELPYLLLGYGSGPDQRGLTVVMLLYQRGFEVGDLGMASAIGWVLAMLLVGFALAQRFFGKSMTGA